MQALAILLLLLWFLFGRDPHIVPTVEFYPPQGMTPAEVGYVLDGTADKKDLISLILYFAEKGYLTIEQTNKKKFILHKQCDIPQTEKKFARTLFDGLFGKYGDVQLEELDEEFGEAYMTASEQLAGSLQPQAMRRLVCFPRYCSCSAADSAFWC